MQPPRNFASSIKSLKPSARGMQSVRLFLWLPALLLLSGSISPTFPQSSAHGIKNVFWQPNELQQGSVAFITVEFGTAALRITGQMVGKNLSFFKSDNPKIWYALAGADLETQPGTYELSVRAVLPGGRVVHSLKKMDIAAGDFRSGPVNVPENFVEPDAESQKKIAADQVLKEKAFSHFISRPQWSGDFVTPVQAKPTDSFGMTHIFNEELSSTHRGTDFPVAEGSRVVASNSGTVVLASEMFYEGNCVIVDHGQRLFTIYMHLSEIDVKVGDKLAKDDRLGLSGQTGRATGPHLHMGVQWNGTYLDPTKLLALTLPKLSPRQRTVTRTRPQSPSKPD